MPERFNGVVLSNGGFVITWQSFSIGATAAVRFVQPNSSSIALNRVLGPDPSSILGSLFGFARGGVFASGRELTAFAQGGVVNRPTLFPFAKGVGLMGEAGPEAILPLARGADGRLGVQAGGGARPVTVVMNITTPDVQGFQRSQGQIAAQVNRMLARGQRNR